MSNFKVKCVKPTGTPANFTLNKVYEVNNGVIVSDNGYRFDGWSKEGKFVDWETFNRWWNCDLLCSHFELVTDPEPFTKDMLKTGMRVRTQIGNIYIVIKGSEGCDFLVGKSGHNPLSLYNDELLISQNTSSDFKIMEVYSCPSKLDIFKFNELGELLWQRPTPKHYTISEAKAKLSELDNDGQPVEIGG